VTIIRLISQFPAINNTNIAFLPVSEVTGPLNCNVLKSCVIINLRKICKLWGSGKS
jgi:hypothetical protein